MIAIIQTISQETHQKNDNKDDKPRRSTKHKHNTTTPTKRQYTITIRKTKNHMDILPIILRLSPDTPIIYILSQCNSIMGRMSIQKLICKPKSYTSSEPLMKKSKDSQITYNAGMSRWIINCPSIINNNI